MFFVEVFLNDNGMVGMAMKSLSILQKCASRYSLLGLLVVCTMAFLAMPDSKLSAKPKKKKSVKLRQTPEQIRAEERELVRLSRSITTLKKDIAKAEKTEKKLSTKLNLYRRKGDELRTSIALLERTIDRTADSIHTTQLTIAEIEKRLGTMQQEYAKLSQEMYKQSVITSGNQGDQVRNTKYMQELTVSANQLAGALARLHDSLSGKKMNLTTFLTVQDRNKVLQQQRHEDLESTIQKNESTLEQVRENKQEMVRQLKEKNEGAKKVQAMIDNLIAKARKAEQQAARHHADKGREHERAQPNNKKVSTERIVAGHDTPREEKNERRASRTDDETPTSGKQGFHKRSLPWPVAGKTIVQPFGAYTNSATNTRMINPGIGIKATRGTAVETVGDGVVSLVHWLPGYGSLVIVDHRNGFRTVYANLSTVLVT